MNSDTDILSLSEDPRLHNLIKTIVREVRLYAESQIHHIRRYAQIGISLSIENDIDKLLEDILKEAKELGNADGGTLYEIDPQKQTLLFKIMHNDSLGIRMGGKTGQEIPFAPVPLYINGKPNYSNVSSYVALTGERVNIADVYEEEGFDFSGTKKYDNQTGYRCQSMLVIPMKNHEQEIIGVLQLLNSQNADRTKIVPFPKENVGLIESLASQASVALTKTKLIHDLRNLLYAFIRSIATAIDKKSPYTGGHIERVVKLTEMIALAINESKEGPFKDIVFSKDELEELRLAAWMHDVGKITTPEHIVDKPTKLQTLFDRIHLIETRFQLIAQTIQQRFSDKKFKLLHEKGSSKIELAFLDQQLDAELKTLHDELEFLKVINKSGESMNEGQIERLQQIGAKTYQINGCEYPYLNKDEIENLSIRKGTLTERERREVENHAAMTWEILKQLPFPRNLVKVPEYAASHHEKLNGKGYSRGLCGNDLPLQARILAIADVFEALTAKDRPYKDPMKLSQAVQILEMMKEEGHIDPDIYDLFIGTGLYRRYACQELAPAQIDE